MPPQPKPIAERLAAKLKLDLASPLINGKHCLLWQGKVNEKGYGYIRDGKRMRRVNRVVYELAHGNADACLVCHRCDTPRCGEPAHLFLCNDKENAMDRARKLRGGRNKLSPAQVCRIRFTAPGRVCRDIAAEYGVDHHTVIDAISGANWSWVDCARGIPKAA